MATPDLCGVVGRRCFGHALDCCGGHKISSNSRVSGCWTVVEESDGYYLCSIGRFSSYDCIAVQLGGVLTLIQSFAACITLTCCAILAGGRRHQSTTRARQLVLSCVFFDPTGRIMVSPQALLPTRKVVDRYINKVFSSRSFNCFKIPNH